jgi:hypothetical protein
MTFWEERDTGIEPAFQAWEVLVLTVKLLINNLL